jgi:hypothetical protein
MLTTYNIQFRNGNYFFGHEPGNGDSAVTGDQWKALVLTIEQARAIVKARRGGTIVISVEEEPISDDQFKRELHCIAGGSWYDWNIA